MADSIISSNSLEQELQYSSTASTTDNSDDSATVNANGVHILQDSNDHEEAVIVKAKTDTMTATASSIAEDKDNPFTQEDIKMLMNEANELSDKNGWKEFKTTKLAKIWRKTAGDSTAVQKIKGSLLFPGIPHTEVLELIVNMDVRIKWEKQFRVIEIIEEHDNHRVIYWRVKTPKGTSDRDFVMYITHGVDETTGGFYVLYKNATHPKKPEIPGVIRAENIFSGALIYPDKEKSDSTRVILLAQDNLKGSVPKVIMNLFYSKAPLDWRDNLDNFYHKDYKHIRTRT